jgi:hypothetical protein
MLAALTALSAPSAEAALVSPGQIKKWPEEDAAWARSFDLWMSDDELKIFVGLKTSEERREFVKKAGYLKKWEDIDEEMLPFVMKGEVVPGMSQDLVYMCWDKPAKIRKDFKKDAYVDVLNYEFERDRKGREWLLRPDSQTSYKNEIVTKYVYMFNGKVWRVIYAGEEESILDELPVGGSGTTKTEAPAHERVPEEEGEGSEEDEVGGSPGGRD